MRLWRRRRGRSQQWLADALGLTRASVCRIEKGIQGPSAAQVAEIAFALGLSEAEFYGPDAAVEEPAAS